MKTALDHSDGEFLNELHRLGGGTVQQIANSIGVTATAVRQRLTRLQAVGVVSRELVRAGRGRPHHVYQVTSEGLRQLGDNYNDLALILWQEVHKIEDSVIRERVTGRVRDSLVSRLGTLQGESVLERLEHLQAVLVGRGYDVEVQKDRELPILRENNCPYQELADEDRGICDLEQDVFQQVLGADVRLSQCCLDGHHCCEFEVSVGTAGGV